MAARRPGHYEIPRCRNYDVPVNCGRPRVAEDCDRPGGDWELMFAAECDSGADEERPQTEIQNEPIYAKVDPKKKTRKKAPDDNSLFDDSSQNYDSPIWPPILAPEGSSRSRVPRIKTEPEFSSNSREDDVFECQTPPINFEESCKLEFKWEYEDDSDHIYEDISEFTCAPSVSPQAGAARDAKGSKPKVKTGGGMLAAQAAKIKELSGSLWNVLNLSDVDQSVKKKRPNAHKPTVPIQLFEKHRNSEFKRACTLYFEGCMAVGKSTLIQYIQSSIGEDSVITFPEPMYYWTMVYDNVLKQVYKANRNGGKNRDCTSAELLACQMKFVTPLKSTWTYTNRQVHPKGELVQVAPFDNWVIFDRHMLSACVVFPLILLNKGMLSFKDFISIMGTFQASVGDTIVLLTLEVKENLKRLKNRSRKYEGFVDLAHLKEVRGAFNTTYYAWLFLQYFSVEEVLKVCTKVATLKDICAARGNVAANTAAKIWNSSLFATLEEVIEPFNHSCTLIEVCSNFCHQLTKIQFVVVDMSEFHHDEEGAWGSIYMQTMKNPDIKTRSLDWKALKTLSAESYRLQTLVK